MALYTAWIREHSGYTDGWVAYMIRADSRAEAVEKARARFAGTSGAWTLEVDAKPEWQAHDEPNPHV